MIEATASKSFAEEEEGRASALSSLTRADFAEKRVGSRGLVWLNLLCLDAPLVAVSWQWLFARSFGIEVTHRATAALFLTSWLIYLADRLADCRSLDQKTLTSLRQRFCLRHRAAWLVTIGVVALANVAVCAGLEFRTLQFGFALGGCAFVYLLVNQRLPLLWRALPLKEIAIGFLFAAGTLVPLAPGLTTAMLPAWFLFGSICSLNCLSIAVWERDLDGMQRRITIATAFPGIDRLLLPASAVLVLASFAIGSSRIYFCLAGSAILLGLIQMLGRRIEPNVRTALADLALLSPIAALLL